MQPRLTPAAGIIALNPCVEDAVADIDGLNLDQPFSRFGGLLQKDVHVVVACRRIIGAVIAMANGLAVAPNRSITAKREKQHAAVRCDQPHSELVARTIPDLDFVRRAVPGRNLPT